MICNDAGVFAGGPAWECGLADYEWVLGVNTGGVVRGVRTSVPILLERAIEETTAGGGSPARMAGRVIRAIRSNRFDILSEDVRRDCCDTRLDDIREGRNPTLAPPLRARCRRLARPAPRRIVWALEQPERLPFSSP